MKSKFSMNSEAETAMIVFVRSVLFTATHIISHCNRAKNTAN